MGPGLNEIMLAIGTCERTSSTISNSSETVNSPDCVGRYVSANFDPRDASHAMALADEFRSALAKCLELDHVTSQLEHLLSLRYGSQLVASTGYCEDRSTHGLVGLLRWSGGGWIGLFLKISL